jgi:O-acetyl-ADP-ribose deacetylase (regulator of RNase III)
VLSECTAVGYTAKGDETWSQQLKNISVQAVGTPPYPGHRLPRVLGWLSPHGVRRISKRNVIEVQGDATAPQGRGNRMIVHLVNDRTANWGGAFTRALRTRYPKSQEDFHQWVQEDKTRLRLGGVRYTEIDDHLSVATLIAQRGYGASAKPRIRYTALRETLDMVGQLAQAEGASVHMPRIGAGQAGGRWPLVREIVEETLTRRSVPVTVYVPPGQPIVEESEPQTALQLDL